MKKILFLLALVLPMLFASCSKDDDEKTSKISEDIVGTWVIYEVDLDGKGYLEMPEVASATFNSDGTYKGKGYFGDGDGTYKIEDKTIFTYVSGVEFYRYDILNLSSNNCELKMYIKGSNVNIKIKCKRY